ncbi:endoribonuclease MazF [Prolixibacter sp. SD074]|jgi:mRNA interferase MazF|uniref:endoribonuclease MazF n=1 Tax=Prolixibacter sp. SD074 TaxID=2652391 RepID=UPI001282336D|nr:endoribonuclease MazF [Prolixibacter sp. SD074]GET29822.1 mRNA-degrading endonuclease [Prolixibacter sp. SD074]
MVTYVPDEGDFIYLDFNPQAGHEQAGHRPALVISPREYNLKTSLCVVCPVTNQSKGYPFEVDCDSKNVTGVILADAVKSLDWKVRRAKFIGKASTGVLDEVKGKLGALLGI